jgi:hypothetical protein
MDLEMEKITDLSLGRGQGMVMVMIMEKGSDIKLRTEEFG